VSDQVNVDKWSVRAVLKAVHYFWVPVRVAYLCFMAVMRDPDLIVAAALSNLTFYRLIRCCLRSAGTFCHESSWTNQRSGILVCLMAFPTATIMRVNHKDLVLCTFNLASPRIIWKWLSIHISDFFIVCAKAEEARVTLMSDKELTVASALTKTVVRIAACNWARRVNGTVGFNP